MIRPAAEGIFAVVGPVIGALYDLSGRAQVIAVVVTVLMLGLVLELVRRRRLIERYALLWIFAALVLVVLAIWNGGLRFITDSLGILSPANALFLLGLAVVFALLLHFSVAISRLSEEAKILAQESARLDSELRRARGELPAMHGGSGEAAAPKETAETASVAGAAGAPTSPGDERGV